MSYNEDIVGQFISFNENANNIDYPQLEITFSSLDGDINVVSKGIDKNIVEQENEYIENQNQINSQRIKDLFESLINSLDLKDDNSLNTFPNHIKLKQLLLPNSITFIDAIKINSLLKDWLKSNILIFNCNDLKFLKNFIFCLKLLTNYSIDLNNSVINENKTTFEIDFLDTLKSEIINLKPYLIKIFDILNSKLASALLNITFENIILFFSIYIDIKTLQSAIEDLNDENLLSVFHLNLKFLISNYNDYYDIFLKFSSYFQKEKLIELVKTFSIPSCFFYSKVLLADLIIMLITDPNILNLLLLDRNIDKKLKYFNELLDDIHCKENINKQWVINNLKESLVNLCLGNEFEISKINKNSSLNKLSFFFNITKFGMDETNFKYFWDGIFQLIKQNNKLSLKENFILFLSYLTEHQRELYITIIFQKFINFLHDFISFPSEIEFIEKIMFHINELQIIFDQTQLGYLKAYVKLVNNMIQNIHVSSIVEVMDVNLNYLEDHRYPNFKFPSDCKLVYPKIITKNLRLICTQLKNEKKKVNINSNFQSVLLNYNCEFQTYSIRCDSFIAIILLSFETVNEMKFNELQTQTKIKEKILKEKVNKLVEYGLLTMYNDTISLVVDFSSPNTQITIVN